MANVLVTGASGFIGTHLVESLVHRGDRVRCLVRRTSPVEFLRQLDVELVKVSFDDRSHLRRTLVGVETVFHLAGATCAHRSHDLYRVNRDATYWLAEACAAQTSPPTLVVVSSIAAAGPTTYGTLKVESDAATPVSHYGASKRAGEVAAECFADRVPTTIVRPAIVFGPRNRELLPVFRSIAFARTHVVPYFVPPPLSFIHVADLVELLLDASQRGQRIQTDNRPSPVGYYFAASSEHPTYAGFGRLVAKALGVRPLMMVWLGQPIPWLVAGINQCVNRLLGRTEPLNLDKIREASCWSWACSSAAAQRDLHFTIRQSLADSLRETADWYRQHDWLSWRRAATASLAPRPSHTDPAASI